jgi:hypothetical protein
LQVEFVWEEFLFAVDSLFEDVEAVVGFEVVVVVVAVDDSEVAEEEVQFHQPEGVAAEVLPDVAGRHVFVFWVGAGVR